MAKGKNEAQETQKIDVTTMSKEDLQKFTKAAGEQLAVIKQKEDAELLAANGRELEKLREHKDVILALVEHGRTSCSDTNIANGYGSTGDGQGARCNKCHLIEILNGEWGDEFAVRLSVDIYRVV